MAKRRQLRTFRRDSGARVPQARGRRHVVNVSLTQREMNQLVVFLILLTILFSLAMYIGWWTLQEEEKDYEHRDADLQQSVRNAPAARSMDRIMSHKATRR